MRNYAEAIGLRWQPTWEPQIDAHLAELKLTQEQVDGALRLHAWYLHYVTTPRNFHFIARCAMALRWLLNR